MPNNPEELIRWLEFIEISQDIDVEYLLKEYKHLYGRRPLWRMIEDIQRQAMLYTNIIELLKSGKQAPEIRRTFEEYGLVPAGVLPNPNEMALLARAFNKIAQYRQALVDIVKRFGGELLNELEFEAGQTISVGVSVGFPPAVTIAIEHTAKIIRAY
jgi:hypothetical protein